MSTGAPIRLEDANGTLVTFATPPWAAAEPAPSAIHWRGRLFRRYGHWRMGLGDEVFELYRALPELPGREALGAEVITVTVIDDPDTPRATPAPLRLPGDPAGPQSPDGCLP